MRGKDYEKYSGPTPIPLILTLGALEMTKSARRKDSEKRSIELDLKIEVMLLKEQLMELQEDYDDLWNFASRALVVLDKDFEIVGDGMFKELQGFKRDRYA